MSLTNAWSEAVPTDENFGYELDDYHRRLALDVRERLAVQHKAYADETGHTDVGEHTPGECTVVKIGAKATFPTPATTTPGCFAIATDEGNQPYYWSGSGWIKVQEPVLITGNQTIAGAKTFSDAVVINGAATLNAISTIKDGSAMSTSGAPTTDAMIANKKYVDDQIDGHIGDGAFSPLAYAGEESVTFPNGLIVKKGLAVYVGANKTITFNEAFPTACDHVQLTIQRTTWAENYTPTVVGTPSKTSFVMSVGGATGLSIYWRAEGR